MTRIKITPTKLKGTVTVPPSKSLAHRAIICASLAKGKSHIDNIEYSQDILATIDAMKALGTSIIKGDNYLDIDGSTTYTKDKIEIDCKESGSTLRFMIPISLVKKNMIHYIGEGNLGKRPLDTYFDIFDNQGIEYIRKEDILDMYIIGNLKEDTFKIPGDISSQFITGLLFALPLLEKDSKIIITSTLESKGYIDLTLDMLRLYGIEIINKDYQEFIIKGSQEYKPQDYRVEADFSQAAFYLVAGAIGNDITLTDLNLNSLQGDKEIISILKRMGASIQTNSIGVKMIATSLNQVDVDASQCPDVIPVASVALALAKGTSKVFNARRLRIKECDRLSAVVKELNKLGVKASEGQDSFTIEGTNRFNGSEACSYDDHRMAMMLAIASSRSDRPIYIDNKECVKKSYPSFWEDFKKLGGKFDECNIQK